MTSWRIIFVTLLVFGTFMVIYTSPLNLTNLKVKENNFYSPDVYKSITIPQNKDLANNFRKDSISNLSKLFQMSSVTLRSIFEDTTFIKASTSLRIMYYSTLSVGTPYMLSSLGEGPLGRYDKDPLVDLTRVDCMTFCEQIVALSISNSYDDFIHTLQKIRYSGNIVDIKDRNHFVIGDWLPNNSWLIQDVTREIGGTLCLEMTKTINRREFLVSLGCMDTANVKMAETLIQDYIPKNSILPLINEMQNGDIICIATHKKGLFVSHMGFIITKENGGIIFRNASQFGRKVVDEPFEKLVQRMNKHKSVAGIIILRVRSNFALK